MLNKICRLQECFILPLLYLEIYCICIVIRNKVNVSVPQNLSQNITILYIVKCQLMILLFTLYCLFAK